MTRVDAVLYPLDRLAHSAFADEFGKHRGTDIFAPVGTPVVAVDAGAVRFGTDPLGGNVANLTTPDGTRYYYAHLSRFNGADRSINAGDVLGYVGNTGNAAHTSSHLHFEIHPKGGDAIDPYPLLADVAPAGSATKPVQPVQYAAASSSSTDSTELAVALALLWWWSKHGG